MTEPEFAPSIAKRGRAWAIACSIAAVVIVAASVVFLLNRPHDSPPSPPATAPTAPTPSPSATDAVWCPSLVTYRLWDEVPFSDGLMTPVVALPQSGQFTSQVLTRLDGSVAQIRGVRVDEDLSVLLTGPGEPGSGWSMLTLIDIAAGRVRWSLPVTGTVDIVAAPAIDGVSDIVVVSFPDAARLVAYDLTTGTVHAERDGLAVSRASVTPTRRNATDPRPAPADGFIVTSRDTGTVYRLDATTLTTRWTKAVDPNHGATQVGDVIFASGVAYDATTGAKLGWTPPANVYYDGASIATAWSETGASAGTASGIDLRTGEACWTRTFSQSLDSNVPLASADSSGGLWIIATDGTLQRLDPATGAVADARGKPTGVVTQLEALGDAVMVWTADGSPLLYPAHGNPVSLIAASDSAWSRFYYQSGNQLVLLHAPPGAGPGSLEAFSLADGASVWKADAQLFRGVAGLMLRFDATGGTTVVRMLR